MPFNLYIVDGCFQATTAELNSCDGDWLACKPKNIYYLALYEKFANPWFKSTEFGVICYAAIANWHST